MEHTFTHKRIQHILPIHGRPTWWPGASHPAMRCCKREIKQCIYMEHTSQGCTILVFGPHIGYNTGTIGTFCAIALCARLRCATRLNALAIRYGGEYIDYLCEFVCMEWVYEMFCSTFLLYNVAQLWSNISRLNAIISRLKSVSFFIKKTKSPKKNEMWSILHTT